MLRRYWFEFESKRPHHRGDLICAMPWACGVTAYDEADALAQVRDQFPDGFETHSIRRRVEDVDVAELADEVAGRLTRVDFGVPVVRGIWYPHIANP